MKKIGLLFIIVFVFNCKQFNHYPKDVVDFIPKDFNTLYKINNQQDFELFAKKNPFATSLLPINRDSVLNIIDQLSVHTPLYMVQQSKPNSSLIYLTKYHDKIFKNDSLKVDLDKLYQSKFDNSFKYIIKDSVFIGSYDAEWIKNIEPKVEKANNQLLNSTDNSAPFSILRKKPSDSFEFFWDVFKNKETMADIAVMDVNSIENNLIFNGILKHQDSLNLSFSLLKTQQPQVIEIPKVVHQDIENLSVITYQDYSKLNTQSVENELLNLSNQAGVVSAEKGQLFYLHILDESLLKTEVENYMVSENFKGIDIYAVEENSIYENIFPNLLSTSDIKFAFAYNSFFIGSNSLELLKENITAILNGTTLEKYRPYLNTKSQLSDACSMFLYKNNDDLNQLINTEINNYPSNIIQFTCEKNITHINGVFKKQKLQYSGAIEEFKNVNFEDDLISNIHTLKDLKKDQNYICVQDVKNHLYLLNENGSILFNIPLKKPVIGAPKILSLRNSDAKIAFVTESSLYLVNTKGENLKGFPKKFRDKITQPVSVFNYDNDRNFRIVITQQNELLMYDGKGKQVKGFKPKKTTADIKQPPKHFRIFGKDYIVFSQGERLEVLNRKGQTRIPIKTPVQFSKNEIYNYKNKFSTTNALGQLVQVNTKGKLMTKNLNLETNHKFTATLNTLVTFNDNLLKIKNNTAEMPYGEYTHPEIFYLKDKIYISITDLQNQKVYLFDSQAKSISNFPVYGTSAAKLQYSETKKSLQLITKSDDKNIIFYSFN